MRYLLFFVLASFTGCDSKTTTVTAIEASIVPSADAPLEILRNQTDGTVDSTKVPRVYKIPDFSKYTDVNEKKRAFFDFLKPMMVEENTNLEWERARLKAVYYLQSKGDTISSVDLEWVNSQAKKLKVKNYDISDADSRLALTKKIDIIPPSMFLAQAANESAWGTSRFSREANNIFGQWCFNPGCGIVPSQRAAGETHEVQKFVTVNDAVTSYVYHINSNRAYTKLRELRYAERNKGKIPSGTVCAGGLQLYSARGEEYVKEIRNMIRTNKLELL